MEREVLKFLQNSAGQLFSAKEVGKKLDRNQFTENPSWARPLLQKLSDQGLIQKRDDGFYSLSERTSAHLNRI